MRVELASTSPRRAEDSDALPAPGLSLELFFRVRFPHVARVKLFPLTLVALLALVVMAPSCKDTGQTNNSAPTNSTQPLATPYLSHAQPRLETMKLFVGPEELTTELAMKPTEIYTGMMWRTNMPEGEAMLFVFGDAEPRAFYMRNTYVPLSLAYIDTEGVIQEIHDLQPRNETSVPSKADNIQFVLEVPQGWFARHKIAPGTVVRSQYGELKKTFSFSPLPGK
jgi:uncharacterized membrane protein (UPF0127 family)